MVISSAKQELINTDKSIKEISEEFHFPTQSFFGKYFKQYVGVSPKAFRKQQRAGLSVDLDSDE
jgi:AraC-like DNA-binding protein